MPGKRREITWEVDENGCHNCTSHAINTDGYPRLWRDGANRHMHRVLYQEAFGPVPEDIVIRHLCDNPRCINLDHLRPGTHKKNSEDMVSRGRCNTPRGEKRSDAKLSLKQVLRIAKSKRTQRELAEEFGVNQSTISRIRSGKRWPDRGEAKWVSK